MRDLIQDSFKKGKVSEMFNYREIENWFSRYNISDDEADRIAAKAETIEQFESIWQNEDWWCDARECVLDGIDGPKDAWCYAANHDNPSHVVKAKDGSILINVGKRVVESRFADYLKPTFYYS